MMAPQDEPVFESMLGRSDKLLIRARQFRHGLEQANRYRSGQTILGCPSVGL
jgi:hypothetical protein